MAETDEHATMEELLEAVFSERSVPRIYNEKQLRLREGLETAVRGVGVMRQSPASKNVSTEAEEATALEAVIRRQPVKIYQTEKT
jgi:hypothetical protein